MKKCPYCAEEIQDEAIKCKHCGEWIKKQKTSSTVTMPQITELRKPRNYMLVAFFIQYVGYLFIILGNTEVIPRNFLYSGGAFVSLIGGFVLILATYSVCQKLSFRMAISLILSIVNFFLLFNAFVTLYLLKKTNKKMKEMRARVASLNGGRND